MNEDLNLVEILKDCPKGTVLYSTIYGNVTLFEVQNSGSFPIKFMKSDGICNSLTARGLFSLECEGECVLFPSKDQRDWSKFTAPWYKKERFDPRTLKPFDKVLVFGDLNEWTCDFYSHTENDIYGNNVYICVGDSGNVIPYNDDTKHLVGIDKEAPKYYRYWED